MASVIGFRIRNLFNSCNLLRNPQDKSTLHSMGRKPLAYSMKNASNAVKQYETYVEVIV